MVPLYNCHCVSFIASGIAKVARKLDIDYAPAMMGWDHHSGYCHPVYAIISSQYKIYNVTNCYIYIESMVLWLLKNSMIF